MKKYLFLFIILFIISCGGNTMVKKGSDDDYVRKYKQLSKKLMACSLTELDSIDYTELRATYFFIYDKKKVGLNMDFMLEDQFNTEYNDGEFEKAKETGYKILERNITDIRTQTKMGNIHEELGNSKEADYHYKLASKLAENILMTGEGSNPETAIEVYNPREIYDVLMYLGLHFSGRETIEESGKYYDKITSMDQAGNEMILYFDITTYTKLMQEKQKS